MRVLSPRIEPPERDEDGSIASTATLWPRPVSRVPSASMKVLLPTPGTPEMPTRTALPLSGSTACRTASASARWRGLVLSISVIARASPVRSPTRIAAMWSSGVGRGATEVPRARSEPPGCAADCEVPDPSAGMDVSRFTSTGQGWPQHPAKASPGAPTGL